MVLENKLGITDATELARAEEHISKSKACTLMTSDVLEKHIAGSFQALAAIHAYLFSGSGLGVTL